jgi:hypothetical protein
VSKSTYPAFLASGGNFSGSPVVFDKTFSGYHHGYSTSTGIFTVDRHGVYVFHYYFTTTGYDFTRATLNVNGISILDYRSVGFVYHDSAVYVLQLSTGDKVTIERKYGTSEDVSFFFGTLLFEM